MILCHEVRARVCVRHEIPDLISRRAGLHSGSSEIARDWGRDCNVATRSFKFTPHHSHSHLISRWSTEPQRRRREKVLEGARKAREGFGRCWMVRRSREIQTEIAISIQIFAARGLGRPPGRPPQGVGRRHRRARRSEGGRTPSYDDPPSHQSGRVNGRVQGLIDTWGWCALFCEATMVRVSGEADMAIASDQQRSRNEYHL